MGSTVRSCVGERDGEGVKLANVECCELGERTGECEEGERERGELEASEMSAWLERDDSDMIVTGLEMFE